MTDEQVDLLINTVGCETAETIAFWSAKDLFDWMDKWMEIQTSKPLIIDCMGCGEYNEQ